VTDLDTGPIEDIETESGKSITLELELDEDTLCEEALEDIELELVEMLDSLSARLILEDEGDVELLLVEMLDELGDVELVEILDDEGEVELLLVLMLEELGDVELLLVEILEDEGDVELLLVEMLVRNRKIRFPHVEGRIGW
jgi:hypothetical protein